MTEIVFLTSSKEKIAHARYVFREYPIKVSKQKNYGKTYEEPRVNDREELLSKSIEDAMERWKKNSTSPEDNFFFIEDTSVIIEALSNNGNEVPGVDVKYWMRENTFDSIDRLLNENGNNRKVIVRSDVILYLPHYYQEKFNEQYLRFTSSTNGRITEVEYEVKTNPLYPWLSGTTFNKWFVPDGADKPISLLSIEDADRYDFRIGSYKKIIEFLERNLKIKKKPPEPKIYKQVPISFKTSLAAFIIVGPTCSGKSTLAEYLLKNYKFNYFEASDFMHLSYYENHGLNSKVKIGDFAKEVLLKKPNIVSDQILEKVHSTGEVPFVISGFRSPNEIESFLNGYAGSFDIKTVLVNAKQMIRYERNLKRNRTDMAKTFDEFQIEDEKQVQMGIAEIMKDYNSNEILNESTFDDYFLQFEKRFSNHLILSKLENSLTGKNNQDIKSLEDKIILSLFKVRATGKFLTTTKIAHLVNSLFPNQIAPISKNNVSRYFNIKFYPYYEIMVVDEKNMYRLSQTGIGRAYSLLRFYESQ